MSDRIHTADTGYPTDYEPSATYDTLGTNYESTGTTYDLTVGYEAHAPSGYGNVWQPY